jgi:hypothetical protein
VTNYAIQPSWRFIQKVACPQCGAAGEREGVAEPGVPMTLPGERCKTPAGALTSPHGKRRAVAAEKGLWVPGGTQEPA